ncbi:MAG: glutamate--tRNA ligase [Bacteroidales bacterium]|nr:glutamate--tRNA ligase [Bacteroidales bacterium]
MQNNRVRVRFAPSPTGTLHIGGVRTALYNYLFAKQHGGDFLLRIEDTDSQRFVPGAEEYIIEALRWLGIPPDEGVSAGGDLGPYRQSERRDIYRKYVDYLLAEGKGYKAYDTPEELDAVRKSVPNFQYDASTRLSMKNSLALSPEECRKLEEEGVPFVLRLKIEPGEDITVHDLIRGDVTINSSILDDKVLYKQADDLPTYHLANIVDDHLMQVTHVIRGEEWLPSAPLHVLLYRALGWADEMPAFAHLPLILKPEGSGKLSKRDGDRLGFPVFPLQWDNPDGSFSMGYRESGYLPEAVVNFLAFLGWNPGTEQEIMSMDELVEAFRLENVSKSGAKFDYEKARWFNHKYVQDYPIAELAELSVPFLRKVGLDIDPDRLAPALMLIKDRITLLSDVPGQVSYLFVAPDEYDPAVAKKRWKASTPEHLEGFIALLDEYDEEIDPARLEERATTWLEEKGYGMGAVMNALRLALVGKSMGPHIFDIIAFLGKTETVTRIRRALRALS